MKSKKEHIKLLEETCRVFNSKNRSTDGNYCLYFNPEAKEGEPHGCAIGRLLSKEGSKSLEENFHTVTVRRLLNETSVKELEGYDKFFLTSLQDLHDRADSWDKAGLTKEGQDRVAYIKNCINSDIYESLPD